MTELRTQLEDLFEKIEHEASFAWSHYLPFQRLKFECLVKINDYVDQLWELMHFIEDDDVDYEAEEEEE